MPCRGMAVGVDTACRGPADVFVRSGLGSVASRAAQFRRARTCSELARPRGTRRLRQRRGQSARRVRSRSAFSAGRRRVVDSLRNARTRCGRLRRLCDHEVLPAGRERCAPSRRAPALCALPLARPHGAARAALGDRRAVALGRPLGAGLPGPADGRAVAARRSRTRLQFRPGPCLALRRRRTFAAEPQQDQSLANDTGSHPAAIATTIPR